MGMLVNFDEIKNGLVMEITVIQYMLSVLLNHHRIPCCSIHNFDEIKNGLVMEMSFP